MSDFRFRLMEEHNQLLQRLEALKAFIVTEQFFVLPDVDRKDLQEQLKHMSDYFDVLNRRLCRQAR